METSERKEPISKYVKRQCLNTRICIRVYAEPPEFRARKIENFPIPWKAGFSVIFNAILDRFAVNSILLTQVKIPCY